MAKNKFPKTVRLKTYLFSLMLVSVIFLATVAYVASNGGFTAPNLYLDSLPSTASYVISTDGTYYWSTRYDGKITDYSTNASAVINNAFGNLTSSLIFFKNGVYNVTLATLMVDFGKSIALEGENWEYTVIQDDKDTAYSRTIEGLGSLSCKNLKFDRSVPSSYTQKYVWYSADTTSGGGDLIFDHCQFIGNAVLANYAGDTGGYHSLTGAVGGYTVNRTVIMKDCYIKDFQYGLFPTNASFMSVYGNTLENVQTIGIGALPPMANGTYIIQNNFLNECAWYDEGIVIDSGPVAVAINTNSLIEGNVMYNNAKKIANTGIGVVGSNGVHIIGNKILDLNTAWGNLISVDCGDSVGISNIVIQGNNLQLTQGNGIITYGLQEGSIMGNYIQGATTNYGVGIRIQYCDAVAIGAGKVVVMGNDIRTGTTNERGILVQRSAGTGGIVNIFIDNNYLKSYIGIEADWDGTVFTVTLGKNNIFNSTITVYQTSTGVPKWMELHGTNTTAADGQVQSFNNLVGTPTFVSVTSGNTTVTIICNANTFTATGFTYKLKTLADAAATGQTVYWYVRYDP